MKIFIIRHGETTSDVEDRYGGDHDDHLTERGIAQAEELARGISDRGIEIVFSSPRIRARETSDILKGPLRCDVQIIDDLRERNAYGILTGMEKTEARERFPAMVGRLGDHRHAIEGAEEYDHFSRRVSEALRLVGAEPYTTIAIVTHGGVIRCLFRDILGQGELGGISDCAVIELQERDAGFEIVDMNGTSLAV